MTERSPLWKNWKFLLAFVVLLVLFLLPQIKGLVWGAGEPRAITPPPLPPFVDIQTKPGSGPANGFNACAVLTSDVVEAAGLKYASEFIEKMPEPGKPTGTNSCGGPVQVANGLPPAVLLIVTEQKVTGSGRSHGIGYDRRPGSLPDEVVVRFGAAELAVTEFSHLPDAEAVLAKLIDGVTANLAAGPKPPPEYSYPAPYNLAPRPCDALPVGLFTALTSHPTDGTVEQELSPQEALGSTDLRVKIACERASTAPETVRVVQTIFQETDAAERETKFVCRTAKWKTLPAPIGDVSCASPGDDGIHQILFHEGREMVLVDYRADNPPAGDLGEAAAKIYALLPH